MKPSRRLSETKAANLSTPLRNLLCVKRPLVIVDEAHNARTELSFETLARFNPSAIIEFTATPDTDQNPSNVLYTVSAAELQAEDMIKMPIQLETKPEWKRLLTDAIAQRNALERDAKKEREDTGGIYPSCYADSGTAKT